MPSTQDQLTALFRTVFDDPSIQLSPEMTANDVEGWDSLSHMNLIVAVERHFKVQLTRRELASLKNVGDLIAAVDRKTGL